MKIEIIYDGKPETYVDFHEGDIATVEVSNNFSVMKFNFEKLSDSIKRCGILNRILPDGTTITVKLYSLIGEASSAVDIKKFSGLKVIEADIAKANITVTI